MAKSNKEKSTRRAKKSQRAISECGSSMCMR